MARKEKQGQAAPEPAPVDKNTDDNTRQVVGAAFQGAKSLLVLLAFQRVANFALTQLLVRSVDPEVFGAASIHLDLVLSTALFLSREGFRVALGRVVLTSHLSHDAPFRRFINLSWLPVLLGLIASLACTTFLPHDPLLRHAGLLFCLAAALESLAEPAFLLAQSSLLVSLRACTEGAATLIRSVVTYFLLVTGVAAAAAAHADADGYRASGSRAFGLAQVAFSLSILVTYWGYLCLRRPLPNLQALRDLLPGRLPVSPHWVDPDHYHLSLALSAQSLAKHLLTQGDKIVLSLSSSFYEQGVYALAQNYGSLAVRFIFQPVEESCRLLFGRLGSSSSSSSNGSSSGKGSRASQDVETLQAVLCAVVKLVALVGLVFSCFGFNYTRVLLRILLPGDRWSREGKGEEAAQVLSWYCVYVLLLALNGITEAFVYAVATKKEVGALTLSSALSFLVFSGCTLWLLKAMGTSGLVLANCAAMLSRIIFSLVFIQAFFRREGRAVGLADLLPSSLVLSLFAASFAICYASAERTDVNSLPSAARHVALGTACLVVVVVGVYLTDRRLLSVLQQVRKLARQ